jgi:N-terminal domain of anti-restriction factor ArdC
MRTDIYEKITNQIVSELEKGVRPWLKPWNAKHAAGQGIKCPDALCHLACKKSGRRYRVDPFERRFLTVALASSELAGVAETRRARVV